MDIQHLLKHNEHTKEDFCVGGIQGCESCFSRKASYAKAARQNVFSDWQERLHQDFVLYSLILHDLFYSQAKLVDLTNAVKFDTAKIHRSTQTFGGIGLAKTSPCLFRLATRRALFF